jgi:predicted TIM-barrel fold metal-dependent hydrolase
VIIDSHLHIGLNGWTEDVLIKYLDDNEIDQAWILTWDEEKPVAPLYYVPLDIDVVKKAHKNHPDRVVPFYAPDPGRKDWELRLNEAIDLGFVGCGELKVSYNWNDPVMEALLEYLDNKKLPLIFHMERSRDIFIPKKDTGADWLFKRLINERFNGKSTQLIHRLKKNIGFLDGYLNKRQVEFPGYLLDFKQLENAVSTYSNIRFIAHGPHTWNNFSQIKKEYLFHQDGKIIGKGKLWKMLEEHSNFFCDLSGFSGYNALSRDLIVTKEFLGELNYKLLFGTDNMNMGLLQLLNKLDLQEDQMEQIMFKNARRILAS